MQAADKGVALFHCCYTHYPDRTSQTTGIVTPVFEMKAETLSLLLIFIIVKNN